MHLVVIGLNHETAGVELREQLRIPEARVPAALSDLMLRDEVKECLLLSTCNRTEIYACTHNRADDQAVTRWIGEFCGVSPEEYTPHLYSQIGHKAAEHLFRVAAGIDSMVVGEAQILGQVKMAYSLACQGGYTGPLLNSLFHQAITVGKRARTETEISSGSFSVSSVAVQLAKSIFGELKGRTVLIIGASKMGELTMTHLTANGADKILVTNRTYARSVDLASRCNGRPIEFEQLDWALKTADIVITATAASQPIITQPMIANVMRARRGRPIFFIDIAVPRDIDADVGKLDNVFVYNIDDLQSAIKADLASRQAEIGKVEAIIAHEVAQFNRWFRELDAVPVISALREQFEGIRQAELGRLEAKLRHLSSEDLEAIHLATRSIINKICHQPMICIKDYANSEDAAAKLDTICEVFGICTTPPGKDEDPPGASS